MTPFDPLRDRNPEELVRRRQRGRATVMALLLGALVVLIFAISIAKIRVGMAH